MACSILPLSAFQSTNLNSKINNYRDVSDRILMNLGCPLVKIEATEDMINNYIAQACELFTKFAGFTEESLIFRSDLYSTSLGVRLDHLFTMATNMREYDIGNHTMEFRDTHYVVLSDLSQGTFSGGELNGVFVQDLQRGDIIDVFESSANHYTVTARGKSQTSVTLSGGSFDEVFESYLPMDLSQAVVKSTEEAPLSIKGTALSGGTNRMHRMYDYDTMDYRKVMGVKGYEEGSSQGINTLFSIEQSLAQQTYFSYAMGNYGFDLVSWHIVQEWMETRQKVLGTRKTWSFDPRTQYMKVYPRPQNFAYGVITAFVERPLRDIVKEPWVQQYALALTKIAVAHVRGKIQGLSLFGGGTVNYNDLMSQGIQEKEKLEKMLFEGGTPGMGDSIPFGFIVG